MIQRYFQLSILTNQTLVIWPRAFRECRFLNHPILNQHTQCIVCESSRIKPFGDYYEQCGLVKCQNCGLVFMEKIPTPEELNNYYSRYSYEREVAIPPLTIKRYHELLDEFEGYRKTGRLLDVGCGRGWFLKEAKKRGWEVYGTEYSEIAIERCSAQGIEMRSGALQQGMFPDAYFDVITSFEVIEHINNPNDDLALIAKFVRKGGLFYCTTPNFNSAMRFYLKTDYNVIGYPEHLTYYTRKTLKHVVEKHGFKCRKFLSTGISINRLRASRPAANSNGSDPASGVSADENLRNQMEQKWYLGVIKSLANQLFTMTNTGLALKGYFVKK